MVNPETNNNKIQNNLCFNCKLPDIHGQQTAGEKIVLINSQRHYTLLFYN